jgi:hypothetical protein
MRALGVVIAMTASVQAAPMPDVLVGDVDFHFSDTNGVGWVVSQGAVTVRFAFGTKPELTITGTRGTTDAQLKGKQDLKTSKWEGAVVQTIPLLDLAHDATTGAITFRFDHHNDQLTGRCVPAKAAGIARTTLYECAVTGFKWHPAPNLPELHHPLVLDTNASAKLRVLNKLTGKSKPQFGQRTLSLAAPLPVPPAKPKRP